MQDALIELKGIRFRYPGAAEETLQGIDFSLMPGDSIALLGPNGSGKSTLLRLLVGLLRPAAGRLLAFGRERIHEKDFFEVRARAGLLFQDPDDQLFCSTVADDVAFGPFNLGKSRAEVAVIVEESLKKAGLEGYASRTSYRLSGGEKRLVSLACVLAMNPDVLLLDEPSAGLDEKNASKLKECLLASGKTLLIASHDKEFLSGLVRGRATLFEGVLRQDDEA